MPDPQRIEQAIRKTTDQTSFVQELLIDTLDWPIDERAQIIDDIAYEWTEDEIRAAGLNEKIVGGMAYQIVLPGNPWGIFILEFVNPDVFTTGRGMTGVLRRVLNGLVLKKRGSRDPRLAAFKQENLLFICNHDYERYRFAHFRPTPDGSRTAPMASFGWGPDDLDAVRTLCEFNLCALEWPDDLPATEEDWLKAWSPAFDVDKVTKRFYQDYAEVFHRLESLIAKQKCLKGDELRLFTQSLFNRLMFLRFIERKGWLKFPGQQGTRYLAALAAGGIGKRSLYASRLRPLFFEGLAEEGKQQSDAYGSVPLLNGGLFEKLKLDDTVADIPDEALTPIIGKAGLFYRYNFTVEESTPLDIEVAVDPEMLGKVFEELVTGRHASGSYYTPRPVVAFMCREALKGYLADRTKASEKAVAKIVDHHLVEGLTEAHARQIIDALEDLKAVDPACGSGAYLLGLLQELVAIRRALQSEKLTADPKFLYKLKLHIISHNLYGVDIDPFATEIAKLRLWLSLAVEADKPVPLPNLDFKIETGDSLLGPCDQIADSLHSDALRTRAKLLVELKDKFLTARGAAKKKYRDAIEKEETAIAFHLRQIRGKGIIDWHTQFAEIFGRNAGFDIVLANPPYLRKEEIPASAKPRLRENFGDAITGRSDLYCSFYARGVQLLRQCGMHVFVCSSAWLDATYGMTLQGYLLKRCHIRAIYDSAVEKQFSTANVNTIVSVLQRGEAKPTDRTNFVLYTGPFATACIDRGMQIRAEVQHGDLVRLGTQDGRYVGDKWGGKYLRAPAIYKRIFGDLAARFVKLGDVADVSGYIHDNNTGDSWEKRDVLWSVKDAEQIATEPGVVGVRRVGVTPYGNSCDFAPILFPRTCGTRHLVPWCNHGVLGKEFYKIVPHSVPVESIVAQLNSTLGLLQREVLGIKGLGGGALKFAAADVALFQIIPDLDVGLVHEHVKPLAVRPIEDVESEVDAEDRRGLDAVIFDHLRLARDERNSLYRDVVALVSGRRSKAKSTRAKPKKA